MFSSLKRHPSPAKGGVSTSTTVSSSSSIKIEAPFKASSGVNSITVSISWWSFTGGGSSGEVVGYSLL